MTVLLLAGLIAVTACGLHRLLPWDIAVVSAMSVMLAWALMLALTARWLQWHPLREQPQAIASLVPLVLLAFALRVFGARNRLLLADLAGTPWTALAFAPSAIAAITAGVNALSISAVSRWFAIIKDPSEHAWLVRDLRATGALDYTNGNLYPRGLHSLIALCASAVGQPETLPAQLQTTGAVVWLSLALCLATLTSLTMRVVSGKSDRFRGLSGLAAGCLVLAMNGAMTQFVTYGAHASLVAISVGLLPSLLTLLPDHGRRLALASLPAVAGLQLNLWSATIAATACVGIALLVHGLTQAGQHRWSVLAKDMAWVMAGLPVALLGLAPIKALNAGGGLAVAKIPGSPVTPSWLTLVVASIGVVWLAWGCRQVTIGALIATVCGYLGMATVLLLASGHPTNPYQWYPMKALWFAIMVCVPGAVQGIAALGGRVLPRIGRVTRNVFGSWATSANFVLGVLAVTSLVLSNGVAVWAATLDGIALALPYTPVQGTRFESGVDLAAARQPSYPQTSERRIAMAMEYGLRYSPAVTVPVDVGYSGADLSGTQIVAMLVRLQSGQSLPAGTDGCAQVRSAAGSLTAVVVTTGDVTTVRSELLATGCSNVKVVALPWVGTAATSS